MMLEPVRLYDGSVSESQLSHRGVDQWYVSNVGLDMFAHLVSAGFSAAAA